MYEYEKRRREKQLEINFTVPTDLENQKGYETGDYSVNSFRIRGHDKRVF